VTLREWERKEVGVLEKLLGSLYEHLACGRAVMKVLDIGHVERQRGCWGQRSSVTMEQIDCEMMTVELQRTRADPRHFCPSPPNPSPQEPAPTAKPAEHDHSLSGSALVHVRP
jgi:hypothetical protein